MVSARGRQQTKHPEGQNGTPGTRQSAGKLEHLDFLTSVSIIRAEDVVHCVFIMFKCLCVCTGGVCSVGGGGGGAEAEKDQDNEAEPQTN